MDIPVWVIKQHLRSYLQRVGKDELRRLLYEVVPQVPPDVVDIFGEVAAWDQQQRPRSKAAQVLRMIGRK